MQHKIPSSLLSWAMLLRILNFTLNFAHVTWVSPETHTHQQ